MGTKSARTAHALPEVAELSRARQLAASGEGQAIREKAGLTRPELAAAIGVDRVTLMRWETGQKRPRAAAALRYLHVLELLAKQ